MPIKTDTLTNSFRILTKNTEYQIKADEYGVLKRVWYGRRVDCDMEYMLDYPNTGFSVNPYDAAHNRNYSLNTLPLEYPCDGAGDFRVPALSVIRRDGSRALDLRYTGFKVLDGKYSIPGLPAVYAEKDEAQTIEIYLADGDITVTLRYGVLPKYDIITRSAVISNKGKSAVRLENAMSMCLDIPYGEWDWIHFEGRHAMERIPERAPLIHGVQESSSKRGASSHQQNPSVILCDKTCSETSGECYGAALMYSGSFKTQIEYDQVNQARLVMGINPDLFSWELKPGDDFHTPEAIMTYSAEGFSKLSHNFHRVIRNNVCRGRYKTAKRPVLLNNWEATYFNFDDEKLLEIAKKAAELGADMFVMDDGWFGKRDSDTSGLGDWIVNENKLKGGLKPLVDKVRKMGLKFGIWIEPEMVSEDSDLFRAHPEWVIRIPGRNPALCRSQLVLDMTRNDVRDYLYNAISAILNSADISYIKWDMNRSICDWYSDTLTSVNMGEMPHRYVLGLYELLEKITSDFPDVLIEGCSGGGGRFDAGILYYCPQIWCSDNTDAYDRTKIQYGTSFIYPLSAVGSHVSASPNHQTGRVSSIEARAVTAMAGSFGYELDLNKLTDEEKEEVKNQITRFKGYDDLIHNGTYHRLSDPLRDKFALWQYVAEDKSEILVHGMIFRQEPNMLRYAVRLRGLSEERLYRLETDGKVYTGKALMNGGILLPHTWGDYAPVELHFTEV
ncbi:MAG: alpha-galactosidase [Oscillospiraceae bacterium]|nr:alpha-galactosidase [Oscillospiraceae bacterium]